jgi:CubicO group peptidase (beta-lactamase class C family)
MESNAVDAAYRKHRMDFPGASGTLADKIEALAQIPLICQPGSEWNYSVSIDVLGRLVEVWSGMTLEAFFSERLFTPLGMVDTGFHVASEKQDRFASLYAPKTGGGMSSVAAGEVDVFAAKPTGLKLQESANQSAYLKPATLFAGGGGLTGTIGDYARFTQMLLSGGELDGQRLLSRKTVQYMRTNQLPGNCDMAAMGQPVWSETSYEGIGFGLGFAVVLDPIAASVVTSVGEHHWGGAASTFFWIDPEEDLYTILFTQLIPSSTYPIRRELRTAVYQTLIDG